MHDLAGALYRLQGSARGWCDREDCGPCPLAPHTCVSGIEERIDELMDKHHAQKRQGACATSLKTKLCKPSRQTQTPHQYDSAHKKALTSIPIDTYFNRLDTILSNPHSDIVTRKIDKTSPKAKLPWQRVNRAFQQPLPSTEPPQILPQL